MDPMCEVKVNEITGESTLLCVACQGKLSSSAMSVSVRNKDKHRRKVK